VQIRVGGLCRHAGGVVAACLGLLQFVSPVNAGEALVMGVHPYLPAETLIERFTPLVRYLGAATGRDIEVRVGSTYEEHIGYIGNDKVDIAYMGPASYVRLVEEFGPRPILARLEIDGKPVFRGHIVTRDDSPVRHIAELQGRRFAFGDPASTMSHLVPRFMLLQEGITTDDLSDHQFLGSHNNVALAVLSGDFDAGAVKEEVFEKFRPQGLRSITATPTLSEHLFVTSKTMPTELVDSLRSAMLALKDAPGAVGIMGSMKKRMTALVPADDSDYDNLRLMLKRLKAMGVN